MSAKSPAVWVMILLLLFLVALTACDRKKRESMEPLSNEEPKLLDPEEPTRELPTRCKSEPSARTVTLRARGAAGSAPASLEFGSAATLPSGFALGALQTEEQTQAILSFTDGRGSEKITELGQVHGTVEVPLVFPFRQDALVVVPDNDAAHTRLRLAKVASPESSGQVTWGPEVKARRGETSYFSLASKSPSAEKDASHALLVWDDFDQASLKSRILGLSFSPATMKSTSAEVELTPPAEDAIWPQIVRQGEGYFLAWLSYGALKDVQKGPSEAGALVEEPPRALKVARLDQRGKMDGEPMLVTDTDAYVLTYTAALGGDGLLLASRTTDEGRASSSEPIMVHWVRSDGTIKKQLVHHERLGPGAPLLLMGDGDGWPWLFARGPEQEVLWGKITPGGDVEGFEEEPGLEGKIPLARKGSRVFVLEPDGLDLRLSVVHCSE